MLSFRVVLGFFIIKPLIDLTWGVSLFQLGALSINPPRVVGVVVFIVCVTAYLKNVKVIRPYSKGLIWFFLFFSLVSSLIAYGAENVSLIYIINVNLRLFDAFLIFFVMALFLTDDRRLCSLIFVIWISTLAVNILSLAILQTGIYSVSISQGVNRFAGLYNDAGSPSYNAVMSFVFGSYYLHLAKRIHNKHSNFRRIVFVITLLTSAILLAVTVTKSALLLALIFIVLWWGIFQKKWHVIIPLIPMVFVYIGGSVGEQWEARFSAEVRVFIEGDYSADALRSLGSGRISTWQDVFETYTDDFSLVEQLIGQGRTYGAHNQYLAELVRSGLLGLMLFLLVYLRISFRLYRRYTQTHFAEYLMGLVLLFMFVCLGVTGHPFYYTTHLWYLTSLMSIINVQRYRIGASPLMRSRNTNGPGQSHPRVIFSHR